MRGIQHNRCQQGPDFTLEIFPDPGSLLLIAIHVTEQMNTMFCQGRQYPLVQDLVLLSDQCLSGRPYQLEARRNNRTICACTLPSIT
mgnify:CR=1 FL=1